MTSHQKKVEDEKICHSKKKSNNLQKVTENEEKKCPSRQRVSCLGFKDNRKYDADVSPQ
jgi:hypothetical protein